MRVRATVRTLLAYPLLLSGVSWLVVIGLVTFVLPKFVDIFGQFEVALPMITQVIVAHVRCDAEALVDLGAAHDLRGRRTHRVAERGSGPAEMGLRDAEHADSARHHAGVLHRPHVSVDGTDDRKRRAAVGRSAG